MIPDPMAEIEKAFPPEFFKRTSKHKRSGKAKTNATKKRRRAEKLAAKSRKNNRRRS